MVEVWTLFVDVCVTVTVAPGTAAPVSSVTVPRDGSGGSLSWSDTPSQQSCNQKKSDHSRTHRPAKKIGKNELCHVASEELLTELFCCRCFSIFEIGIFRILFKKRKAVLCIPVATVANGISWAGVISTTVNTKEPSQTAGSQRLRDSTQLDRRTYSINKNLLHKQTELVCPHPEVRDQRKMI